MTSKRGFAAMTPEQHRAVAKRGGIAAHAQGTAHEFTTETAREAGRKGGASISKDHGHMSRIGQIGGRAISQDPAHMAEIGRLGGGRPRAT